jgi:hypothetical protein
MVRNFCASLLIWTATNLGYAQKNITKDGDFFSHKIISKKLEALSSDFTAKQRRSRSLSTSKELSDHFLKAPSSLNSKKEPASSFSIRNKTRNSSHPMPDHFTRGKQRQKRANEIDHFQNTKLELNKEVISDHFTFEREKSSKHSESDHFTAKESITKAVKSRDHFSAERVDIKRRESDLTNNARPKKTLRKNFVGQKYRIINRDPNKSKAKTKAIKRSKNKSKDPFGRNSRKVNQTQGPKGENGLFQGGVLPKMEDLR